MRLSSITIDADGSPFGYIAWYNHSANVSRIRVLRPSRRNDRYGVQRMEMPAIYFALVDNQQNIRKVAKGLRKKHLVINIQSDSMTCVEQLRGVSEVRDSIMRRIYAVIKNLLARMSFLITFNYLDRNRNIAGLLLEQRRRREEERRIAHWSEKQISTFSSIDIAPVISYKVSAA